MIDPQLPPLSSNIPHSKAMFSQHFDAWRVFRILSEFVEGFETMTDIGPSVSVFGSARIGETHPFYKIAQEVGEKIAKKGFAIITGGGPGIMEGANRGAQAANGRSCGVSIDLPYESGCNPYVDHKYRLSFRYFFVRKVMFVRYAQAFVFLPGGFGTMDELFEALTLIQTKKIRTFPIFLMGKEYWKDMLYWLQHTVIDQKYVSEDDFKLITVTDDPDQVAEAVERHYKETGMRPNF